MARADGEEVNLRVRNNGTEDEGVGRTRWCMWALLLFGAAHAVVALRGGVICSCVV